MNYVVQASGAKEVQKGGGRLAQLVRARCYSHHGCRFDPRWATLSGVLFKKKKRKKKEVQKERHFSGVGGNQKSLLEKLGPRLALEG